MERYQTEAVTLHTRELGETDLIVEFLTREHGRLSGVARGARKSRKRFGARLQKFVCVELQASRRSSTSGLVRIEEVRVKEGFVGLSDTLDRFAMAEVLLELAGRVSVPGGEGGRVFDWLLDAWRRVQADEWNLAAFYLSLLLFLRLQGFLAPLHCCASCMGPPWAFVPERGGVLCRTCGGENGVLSQGLRTFLGDMGEDPAPEAWAHMPAECDFELRSMFRSALKCQDMGVLQALMIWENHLVSGQNQTVF